MRNTNENTITSLYTTEITNYTNSNNTNDYLQGGALLMGWLIKKVLGVTF